MPVSAGWQPASRDNLADYHPMKSPLEAPEKSRDGGTEETSAKSGQKSPQPPSLTRRRWRKVSGKRSNWRKPRVTRSKTAAVLPATFLSAVTISIGFTHIPRRALKIARQAKNFCRSWKVICANMSIRTRSIAPAKFHRKTSRDWRKSVRLESRCRRNMADLVCRNVITDGLQFCLGVGMETWPRSFPRINRSGSRNRCFCSARKSRNKNICRASRAEKSQRSH